MSGVHGGVKFYRGAAAAARHYVEQDRSRADDYYLSEGAGVATRYVADAQGVEQVDEVHGELTGEQYEQWVRGLVLETGKPKGRLRQGLTALRFVEVTVNGPKTWSLAAALHPEVSAALDAAQERAAKQIMHWVAQHATTRIGPRGRQVQVPVEWLEAVVIRHYTSRAGDPHRHLHLQINARVVAAGAWRGLHSVGIRDSIEAINGIGHAAVATDPEFRAVLAAHGFTLNSETGEVEQLAPYAGAFSARTAQIRGNVDRYESAWRRQHPHEEPGPGLREAWDRRAWAEARPDKVVPTDGVELVQRWNDELRDLGFVEPTAPLPAPKIPRIGDLDRDLVVDVVLTRLASKRSAWNSADLRGQAEALIAQIGLVVDAGVREELAEDLTARAVERCTPLLLRPDVPEHVRALTSPAVLGVEADIVARLFRRAVEPARPTRLHPATLAKLDPEQAQVVAALAGRGPLLVVEGAAGAGKTTSLSATRRQLAARGGRLVVVTPTLKAAEVATRETGAEGHSAAWLIHEHGWQWDADGNWLRIPRTAAPRAELSPADLLLVDEAGMLDQDTALALLTVADETGARIAFMGDRHQLPAVGRGGVLDHASAWAHPSAVLSLDAVHRFADPAYADLSLRMRTGTAPDEVFETLHARGQIVVHPTDVERTSHLGAVDGLVIADNRDQVAQLNAAIRARRQGAADGNDAVATERGERIGVGDRVATRRNDPDLGVTNRQVWTVAGMGAYGGLVLHDPAGRAHDRAVPSAYVARHLELAYATTVYGAQGETVDHAHVAVGDSTSASAAYVGMTRGRHDNIAHLVADSVEEAKEQWVAVFNRGRADLGPAHARQRAIDDLDRYGPNAPRRRPRFEPTARPAAPVSGYGIGF